ncbi:DMT family transporter [Paenibacillus dendritiformis]|uniref:DMT family transporter n=1 Tax=Paenibacillus dendritiformis TaxID=130049 RepID=UPI001BCDC68B|nr:DMT family transporter [Paenibacillus dendritiformis]
MNNKECFFAQSKTSSILNIYKIGMNCAIPKYKTKKREIYANHTLLNYRNNYRNVFPIQASIGARLSSYSKTPLTASFIAFSAGTFILLIINLIADPAGISVGIDFSYPWYVFIGGAIAGLGFHVANIVLFSKLGASIVTLVTVTGQMIVGILIDHFGWFGIQATPVSITGAFGAAIMIFAISLVQPKMKKNVLAASKAENRGVK